MSGKHKTLAYLVGIIISMLFSSSNGQCPIGTTISFEKIANVQIRGIPLLPLYSGGQGDTPVSAECNNRCRAGPKCRAFIISYDKHSCVGMDYDSNNRGASIVKTTEKSSFFEKICLSVAPCEKAWTFERVLGKQLNGFDNRIYSGVASRLRCQELCLKERSFVCRSGEYDYSSQECRLSSEDRRSQPSAFASAPVTVDYFENQCSPLSFYNEENVPITGSGCGYQKYNDLDLKRPDLLRSAYSEEQCRLICEATRAFVCRSFVFKQSSSLCWLSSDDSFNSGGFSSLENHSDVIYYERNNCLNLKLDCRPDAMLVSLNTIDNFDGKIYAKEDPTQCESLGRGATYTTLFLPILEKTPKCGIREENGQYSSVIIIQHHPLIQRKGDRTVRVVCTYETTSKVITNSYRVIPGANEVAESAIVNATAQSPNIRLRITDHNGLDVTGARLGEELFLRIEMEDDSVFGIFARDLIAKSGKSDDQITLIENNGCPTDTSIFPQLEKIPGTKSLQGKFDAFKFADDVVVRFQVNVQFCLQDCLPISCPDKNQLISTEFNNTRSFGRKRRHVEEQEGSRSMLLPDYPLQREIIVEGVQGPKSSSSLRVYEGHDMFCTSKATVTAALITTVILQISLLTSCFACILFYRSKKFCCWSFNAKSDSSGTSFYGSSLDPHHTRCKRSLSPLWSTIHRMD